MDISPGWAALVGVVLGQLLILAPIELTDATANWTGREMIVFGAALHGGNFPESETAIGAAYDPATDTWRRLG